MELKSIYRPIQNELADVEGVLEERLKSSNYRSIIEVNSYLLDTGCKRLRPALVLLSAKATLQKPRSLNKLVNIASAIELIHMASLVHDDVIDRAKLRHHRPTINSKWGEDASIALGDFLYSVAFELVSNSGSSDIVRCISSATKAMCEGELLQVLERDNLALLKERYLLIVKKKTASLFAASCQAGASISNSQRLFKNALKEYGLNFGVAFQIIDDYLDLIGEEETLGKDPGQDLLQGEVTLPIINLWESMSDKDRVELENLVGLKRDKDTLKNLRARFFDSGALDKTKETVLSFINLAKKRIEFFPCSPYKDSLIDLTKFIVGRGFQACHCEHYDFVKLN